MSSPQPAPCRQAQLIPSPALLFLKGSLVATRGPHQEHLVVGERPACGAGELPANTGHCQQLSEQMSRPRPSLSHSRRRLDF